MPLVTWGAESDWDRFYAGNDDQPGGTGARVGYSRAWATDQYGEMFDFERRLDAFLSLGITTTDRVLVAGCGFGFLMEVARNRGYPWWGGIDNSATINARRGAEASGDTIWVDEDFKGGGIQGLSRNLQRDLGVPGSQRSARWDWIITESLLESYSDAELTDTLANGGIFETCEWALEGTNLAQIVHLVYTGSFEELLPGGGSVPFAGFNSKPALEDWAALRPAHTWIDAESKRIIPGV